MPKARVSNNRQIEVFSGEHTFKKIVLNVGVWCFPGIWILGGSSPCDTVTPHPHIFSAHLSRAFLKDAEFPLAAFRFSN